MLFLIDIDNPNGSHSTISVQRGLAATALPFDFVWQWEEIITSTLGDDDHDRVEAEIIYALGEADDFSQEALEMRKPFAVRDTRPLHERINEIVDKYF